MTALRTGRVSGTFVVGAVLVLLVVAMAVVSVFWTPHPLSGLDTDQYQTPNGEHWLGTDQYRRDVFSQIMVGAQNTLLVGVVAVLVAAVVGVPAGIVAAMAPRWLGGLLMRTSDLALAFPALLLAIMLAAVYGGGTVIAMVAIGLATIPSFIRITRSGALGVMGTEYVLAARAAGRGPVAIGVRHVLPNVAGLVIVQASVTFAIAILAEAALAYLGLGTPPGSPSWGRMLLENQTTFTIAPHLTIIPGAAIAVAVLGFNLLGDGLRDLLDPRLEQRS